ncbi:hypothetical protein TRICHSKD4_4539 [Roseibium sp. TrichSKD4]|uniref:hypothetical protein n=1 Tax=Roseibium sp. TrichSKD4 TaxID=744980 RepID=UPI0001E57604|nr:hypothetical protein [Roseibium sp. TrichSKD4]EFO30939.1 hypothetical protein TRICHSKD4_4539 [Roseibium sp. TrichSKD4]
MDDNAPSNSIVMVKAARERWRIGRKFPAGKDIAIAISDLTETQLKQLEDDPVLSLRFEKVSRAEPSAEPEPTPGAAAAHLEAALKAVFFELDPEKDLNKDGSPNLGELKKRLGRDVTKAEVTTALGSLSEDKRNELVAKWAPPKNDS